MPCCSLLSSHQACKLNPCPCWDDAPHLRTHYPRVHHPAVNSLCERITGHGRPPILGPLALTILLFPALYFHHLCAPFCLIHCVCHQGLCYSILSWEPICTRFTPHPIFRLACSLQNPTPYLHCCSSSSWPVQRRTSHLLCLTLALHLCIATKSCTNPSAAKRPHYLAMSDECSLTPSECSPSEPVADQRHSTPAKTSLRAIPSPHYQTVCPL